MGYEEFNIINPKQLAVFQKHSLDTISEHLKKRERELLAEDETGEQNQTDSEPNVLEKIDSTASRRSQRINKQVKKTYTEQYDLTYVKLLVEMMNMAKDYDNTEPTILTKKEKKVEKPAQVSGTISDAKKKMFQKMEEDSDDEDKAEAKKREIKER